MEYSNQKSLLKLEIYHLERMSNRLLLRYKRFLKRSLSLRYFGGILPRSLDINLTVLKSRIRESLTVRQSREFFLIKTASSELISGDNLYAVLSSVRT